jgi:hypothetical protein
MSNSIFYFRDLYDDLPFICGNKNKTNYGLDFSKSIKARVIKVLAELLTTKVVVEPITVKLKWQQNK